jgi:hypothetical protein
MVDEFHFYRVVLSGEVDKVLYGKREQAKEE